MFTLKSKIKEIYAHPVGHDILYKILLQAGVSEKVIMNPIIGNLSLNNVQFMTRKFITPSFFNTLLVLLNNEKDKPKDGICEIKRRWWKEAVFYQIYPRSFMDHDGDGIGDLKGIISKLDYLKSLGIDAIWLCPIYDSPGDDNGYDIRDYYSIAKEYGTMEDFDLLLKTIHEKGMRLIMDLVVNHTSDEHRWFKEAIEDKNSLYRDFYFIKEGNNPPNNWTSFFSGSAWNHYEKNNEWALHLFSKKQMDLNWDNENLRKEINKMIRWWLDKGVDGFRLDVINYISKAKNLPEGDEFIGKLMGFCGIEHYFYGPNLHEYLREMRREAFDPYDAFSVGETPGIGMNMSKLLTEDSRCELDMIFSFDILEMPGRVKFDDYVYDLNYLKKYMIEWMSGYGDHCWMSLFYDNHDNPRMLSKVDPEGEYRVVLAKLLAIIQFTLRGTPFLFQGAELGATNKNFKAIEDLRDIESLNLYEELKEKMGEDEAFKKILSGTRDHARVPMYWDNSINGGFTNGTPWIDCERDDFSAENQIEDEDSIWNFYKKLIKLRRRSEALKYGTVDFRNIDRKDLFTYYRRINGEIYFIECNLSSKKQERLYIVEKDNIILSNYDKLDSFLKPYESNIMLV